MLASYRANWQFRIVVPLTNIATEHYDVLNTIGNRQIRQTCDLIFQKIRKKRKAVNAKDNIKQTTMREFYNIPKPKASKKT